MSPSQKRAIRWLILLIVSLVIASNYYVYDAMSSIKAIMQNELGFSSTDYGLIVSFYSFPNTFLLMTVFGGIFLDRFGIRKTGFAFILFCALGRSSRRTEPATCSARMVPATPFWDHSGPDIPRS